MFRPNQFFFIELASGKTDVYGQPVASTRVRERCAVVRLNISNVHTTVRADSSATRGHGMELTSDALILAGKGTQANIDDFIEVAGHRFRVTSKHPRFSITGELDHYEIGASYQN